jgi:hypothetical protein
MGLGDGKSPQDDNHRQNGETSDQALRREFHSYYLPERKQVRGLCAQQAAKE